MRPSSRSLTSSPPRPHSAQVRPPLERRLDGAGVAVPPTVISSKDESAKQTMAFGPGAIIESDADAQKNIPAPTTLKTRNDLGGVLSG